MPKATRIPSPARSQGDLLTPRRHKTRNTRSVGSPARSDASGRLTSLLRDRNMDSFALSPLPGRLSVLTDDTNIEEPLRRKSWWKKLSENSRDVIELLENNKVAETDVIEEYIDIEVLSQQKNYYTNDLPESSDSESINSIVMPQRKLFTQKDSQAQKKFGQLVGNRESLAKLNKTNAGQDKTINAGTKNLFQYNRQRSKPVFPSELLNISPNKTAADKTKELPVEPPKNQVRNIFGNRPATKRKNMFTEFIMSDSEEEIADIQPKIFGFQKRSDPKKCTSQIEKTKKREPSPPTFNSTTDEMDDWKLLPSSTMVDNQLEDTITATPVKKTKLSKLSEDKEPETGTSANMTEDKTNKSVSSKNKSKLSNHEKSIKSNTSIRSRSKSNAKLNKSQNKTFSKVYDNNESVTSTPLTGRNHTGSRNKSQIRNITKIINTSKQNQVDNPAAEDIAQTADNDKNQDEDENNFTLQYEHDEHDSTVATTTNHKTITDKGKNLLKHINVSLRKDSDDKATGNKVQKTLETNISKEFQRKSAESVEETEESKDLEENEQTSIDLQSNEGKNTNVKGDKALKTQADNNEVLQSSQVVIGSNDHEQVTANDKDYNHLIQDNSVNKSAGNQDASAMEVDDAYEDEIELDVSNELQNENQFDDEKMEQDESNEVQNEDSHELYDIQNGLKQSLKVQNEIGNKVRSDEIQNDNDECQKLQNNSKIGLDAQVEIETNEQSREQQNDSEDDEDSQKNHSENDLSEESQESHNEREENEISHEIQNDTDENQELEKNTEENQELENDIEDSQELENNTEENQELGNDIENSQELEITTEENRELENTTEENQERENTTEENQELEHTTEENQEIENDTADNQEIESDNDENQEYESDTEENQEIENNTNDREESQERIDSQHNAEEMEKVQSDNEENESESEVEDNQALQYESEEEIHNESHSRGEESDAIERTESLDNNEAVHSPEAILHDKTNHIHSFTAHDHNATARKTKSFHKSLYIRPSMAPPRESIGMSDGTGNSSAGSGWDSHRITRKTIRQTFGNDYTTRKSLRALVMEKSAKRQTAHSEMHSVTVNHPQANSTELPQISNYYEAEDDTTELTDHEALRKTRQATLEDCLRKIQEQNTKMRLEAEEKVRNSIKTKPKDILNQFKAHTRPIFAARRPAKPSQRKPKNGQINPLIPFDDLPPEVLEDMKYKPPKRFQPSNASWITKRLYKYLETKLEPRYDYKARVRAEKLAEKLYDFTKEIRRHKAAPPNVVDSLKHEMARLDIVRKHSEFYQFFHDFMPKEVRIKVVPDIVNKLPLPRQGVYSDIIRENTTAE